MSRRASGLRAATLAVVILSLPACAAMRRPTTPPGPTPGDRLERADELLAGGRLDEAAEELHALVEAHPASPEAPQALFQLAVVYLAPSSPLHKPSQGISLLRDLVAEYPSSSWSLASSAMLKLASTNADLREVAARLQEQLDKLKQIDIGGDG